MITSYGESQAYLGRYDETTSKMYHTHRECGRRGCKYVGTIGIYNHQVSEDILSRSCPLRIFSRGDRQTNEETSFRGKERCDRTRHNVGIGKAKARSFTSTSLLHIRQRFFGLSFFLSMVHKKSTNSIILRQ